MNPPDVTLITCTSDRPEAFELCQRYVRRQRWRGKIDWVVVDDGREKISVDPPASTNVIHLRLNSGLPAQESFRQNMLAAIAHVEADRVLIFEDDDWYHPDYIGLMVGLLDIRALVGGRYARYYNVAHRKWSIHSNVHHASLCTTGFRAALLPIIRQSLEESNFRRPEKPQQLDGTLWKRSGIPDKFKLLLPKSPHVVGIKGMPGKSGLGIDHRQDELRNYEPDPDLTKLHAWIGDDADNYARFELS